MKKIMIFLFLILMKVADGTESLISISEQQLRQAQHILEKMGVTHSQVLTQMSYFSVPMVVMGFDGKHVDRLLENIERKSTPFKEIHILGSNVLLLGKSEKNVLHLWLKRISKDHYQGRLSLSALKTFSPPLAFPLVLEEQGVLLLDQYSENPFPLRQWIYLLPWNIRYAHQGIQKHLVKEGWIPLSLDKSSMFRWKKGKEEVLYQLEEIDGKVSLYFLKKRLED